MKVALGWKAHSGWAVLVIVGNAGNSTVLIERQRVALVDDDAPWEKQPYHAAEHAESNVADALVRRGVEAVQRVAMRQMQSIRARCHAAGHEVVGCAVLMPAPMPVWSTAEILAVHIRMHKAEGVLFPSALCHAAERCGLGLVALPEKRLEELAIRHLATPRVSLAATVAALGKSVGAPWGMDQKNAALAAMVALRGDAQGSLAVMLRDSGQA
ncbi:hypothetical protein [Dyella subtropica]|uniref:hypothetical protein n=1 Tax=Dyella subtropica TaxID=2992127 RepID=UPI0022570BB3|nr:hypothetical protein [Dyella subtropica]